MKKTILTILITAIICITGTVIASNYLASEVTYKDTTVENALNELYETQNNTITSLEEQLAAFSSSECVGGTYHHESNTQWNVDFGIEPSRFLLSYSLYNTDAASYVNLITFYNGNDFINFHGYTKNSVALVSPQEGSINGTIYNLSFNSTSGHYTQTYDVYYMACK